jgi:16S rRNA (cytosine1402-N4)-methyltransferase
VALPPDRPDGDPVRPRADPPEGPPAAVPPPPLAWTAPFAHLPVMADEVLAVLTAVPSGAPGVVVDGTVGGGGHASRLLAARPDLHLVGIDRDGDAVSAARSALAAFGDRAAVVRGGFEDLDALVGDNSVVGGEARGSVVGVLLDLGVSSPQLDRGERGFSYRADAPLDMRMDRDQPRSAADVVNGYDVADLSRVISRYGEERFARAIAQRIVRQRPIRTTGELADVIRDAIPAPARRTGGHPATRTFQALRIEVNDELGQLERGLDAAWSVLAPGGRIAVLSYHSLEDRIVKERFMSWTTVPQPPRGLPVRDAGEQAPGRLVFRGARRPSEAEVAANPRAASARLRAVERRPDAVGADRTPVAGGAA